MQENFFMNFMMRFLQTYKKVIKDLYDAGCRNIQFDDCTWGVLVAEGSV